MLGNRRYCYPLTITDCASRYLLSCEALSTTQEKFAFTIFERTFKEFGLPHTIRTDNGVPFASAPPCLASANSPSWGLRLGIHIERIQPGHPQQNGRHERMHLTLKTEATKPAAANVLQQQARFDAFVERYNHGRPHQALGKSLPTSTRDPHASTADCRSSPIPFMTTRSPSPGVDGSASTPQSESQPRLRRDLGYFADETCRLEPIDNPFGPTVLPMSPE